MKTLKAHLSLDVKVVVPEQFIATMRKDGAEGAAAFIKKAHELHPVNDEAFIELVISNGLRTSLKANLLELFANSGLGGTVSPAKVDIVSQAPDHDAPTNVQVITRDKLIEQAPDDALVTPPTTCVGQPKLRLLAENEGRSHGGCD